MDRARVLSSVLMAGALSLACSQANTAESDVMLNEEVQTQGDAILDGTVAGESEYPAVGALVYYLPEIGVLDVFCTGTLIAKKAVVTARHCTPSIDFAFEAGVFPAVAFGPDAFAPTQVIPITDYVAAPAGPGVNNGLLLDGGRDVAVVHLESKPKHIDPAKLGLWEDKLLGKKFEIAGYGVHDPAYIYGQKYKGKLTAKTLNGKWYKLIFNNDYNAYLEWYFTDSSFASGTEEEAAEWWDLYKLENKYELLAGKPGEAQACFGDSGGPLMLSKHGCGDTTVYGVSFAVEGSISNVCDLGSAYLVFNKKMLDFVRSAI